MGARKSKATRAERINLLLSREGVDFHEAYRVRSWSGVAKGKYPEICLGCSTEAINGKGLLTPIYFNVRRKGTKCQERGIGVVHIGCIPIA